MKKEYTAVHPGESGLILRKGGKLDTYALGDVEEAKLALTRASLVVVIAALLEEKSPEFEKIVVEKTKAMADSGELFEAIQALWETPFEDIGNPVGSC